MAQSKRRMLWDELPVAVQRAIESIAGDRVVRSENRPGGFSAGLASRLLLGDGRRVFAKAVDAQRPAEMEFHRSEARIAALLPEAVPAPRLLGSFDDGHWAGLVFADVDGHEPVQPWDETELARVLGALADLADVAALPSLPRDAAPPRLGGWAELAGDPERAPRLPAVAPWAAARLPELIALERDGLRAAEGSSLVHFDLYPHNVLLTDERVYFVDWPHARRGNPLVDLVSVLATVESAGVDPNPFAEAHPLTDKGDSRTLDAIIAAHAGFCIGGALYPPTPAYQPILDAKLALGTAYLGWLARRIG